MTPELFRVFSKRLSEQTSHIGTTGSLMSLMKITCQINTELFFPRIKRLLFVKKEKKKRKETRQRHKSLFYSTRIHKTRGKRVFIKRFRAISETIVATL